MLSVSPLGVWRGGRKVRGEVRFLSAFLDFQMLSLRGDARHFPRGLFFMFVFVFRKNVHTPAICHHFVTFGAIFVDVCALRVACFSFFWRPRHFAWTLLTQFGAFFLGLGAQGQNVMKPVSQGTLNVRFARIQGWPLVPFRMHFC